MWLWKKWHCKLVHGWMVYTEPAPRTCAFHVAPAMQQPKSATSTPVHHFHHVHGKDKVTLSESYATCAQWVFSRAELNSYIKLRIIIIIMKVKINWGKIQQTTPFFVDLQLFVLKILDRCSTSSKVHSHENNPWQKWLQFTCTFSITCTLNWELLVFYPRRQRCFGDVKMKHEKRAHKFVKQELVMVSEKVTL